MQYIWQHRLWLPADMTTVDGRRVEIIDPGLQNTGQGPDFFNAKIRIDSRIWAGNVEMHVRAPTGIGTDTTPTMPTTL